MKEENKIHFTTEDTEIHRGKISYRTRNSVKLCETLWLFFFLIFALPIYAQETSDITDLPPPTEAEIIEQTQRETSGTDEAAEGTDAAEETASIPRLPASEIQRIEMELKTSSLSELAIWARMLGLSEGGTREELSRRIREHFNIPEPQGQQTQISRRQKILTINSAQTTEYFRIDVVNEDYARLGGDVKISLKDGDTIHEIEAAEILFNRTRNILTASGGVSYKKIDSGKTETFKGESITVNIDNWSSVFLDGSSTMQDGGTSYLFSGRVISRTDQDVTILNNAQITSEDRDEPYWSISASKLWLFPGSDFAIFNAVLKVGVIPVLYIPFFFFPTDQLVFHPVIGFRSREGGFVQTTTYILGQPKAESNQESSLSRILGSADDSQLELHGIFLRSSGKKVVDPNEVKLRLMADYYVNLGAFAGVELDVPKRGVLNNLEFDFGLGFTRTLDSIDGTSYTPYSSDYEGEFDTNYSNFLSIPVPFRYMIKFNSSIGGKYGSLGWDFPYHSDPYVDRDFMKRAESMDWVKMLQEGAAVEEDTTNLSERSPYTWRVSGSLNPSLPSFFSPYLRLNAINILMDLNFKTIPSEPVDENNNKLPVKPDDPGRFFYAPNRYTIYSINTGINGTPLTLGGARSSTSNTQEKQTPQEPLLGIGIPIPPWQENETPEKPASSSDLAPPILRQTFSLPSKGNLNFSLNYSINPRSSMDMQFWNEGNRWNTFEKVDWTEVQTILATAAGDAGLNFSFSHSSGLFSNTVGFSGNTLWQDFTFVNEEAYQDANGNLDEKKIEQARLQNYRNTNYSTSYTVSNKISPFFFNQVFKNTFFEYRFGGTLVRSKRHKEGESPVDGPELTPQWGSWVKEESTNEIYGLNSHQVSANLSANIMDKTQTLSASYILPPLDEQIRTSATANVWITTTTARFEMDKITETNIKNNPEKEIDDWLIRPVTLTETFRFGNFGSLGLNMTFEPEKDNEFTTIGSTLSLSSTGTSLIRWNVRANFNAGKFIKMEFIQDATGGKWVNKDEEAALHPRDLTLNSSLSFNNINIVKNWAFFTFSISPSLSYNLNEYTKSNFNLYTDLSFTIKDFLLLTFRASSKNEVIWRYFKNVPGMEDHTQMYIDGDQNDLFTDLLDSFNFSDITKRERSGFKMGTFSLSATHYLGDWTATLTMTMKPDRKQGALQQEVFTDFSFLVQWKPIIEIKSDIKYTGKEEKWTIE